MSHNSLPGVCSLIEVTGVQWMKTATCERDSSIRTLTKTRQRYRLGDSLVAALMIGMNGPRYSCLGMEICLENLTSIADTLYPKEQWGVCTSHIYKMGLPLRVLPENSQRISRGNLMKFWINKTQRCNHSSFHTTSVLHKTTNEN